MPPSSTARSMPPLAISWVMSTISGYGIYGLQILLHYVRRGGHAKDLILTSHSTVTMLPPLAQARLEEVFALGARLQAHLQENPGEVLRFDNAVLHACSNDFSGFAGQDRIWGRPNIGCAAIEHLYCTPHGRKIAQNYQMFIAISRWNADYLHSLEIGPVHLCHQGIDTSLFYPAAGSGLYKNRFVIFSGGKFEFRKGQDIVLAAFKRFHATHPDALLVTSWPSLLPPDAAAFALAGHCHDVPEVAPQGLHMTPWLLRQGLPPDSFIDLPYTHNMLLPSVLHECDMAVFPNRCEGGTNLVAMEAMACGIPTYVSYNTGHRDLVDLIGAKAFRAQSAVSPSPSMPTVQDWGETDVEEVVAAMEYVYSNVTAAKAEALQIAERMKQWAWSEVNEKLLQIVLNR